MRDASISCTTSRDYIHLDADVARSHHSSSRRTSLKQSQMIARSTFWKPFQVYTPMTCLPDEEEDVHAPDATQRRTGRIVRLIHTLAHAYRIDTINTPCRQKILLLYLVNAYNELHPNFFNGLLACLSIFALHPLPPFQKSIFASYIQHAVLLAKKGATTGVSDTTYIVMADFNLRYETLNRIYCR